MEQSGIEGNTEVINVPTFEDRNIKLNLKMYEVGDSITYDMIIKNESEEDYMIDEDTFKTDSDYIEYTLKTNDNSNVVKANSSKELSLVVIYKKEVEDNLLTNNKYNASNSLNLSLNTSEKERSLDVITTDNIKEVKNPLTSVTSILFISIILLTTIVIAYILIKRKNRYTKYLLILLSMILIPTVYAICKCDIEVESTIEIEKIKTLFDTIADISNEENACVTKYNGEVTDEVNNTVQATKVYFNKCAGKRNVIFGGFCWQIVRTTETGGTKMIYNGEPVDGKCESGRPNHTGIVGADGTSISLNNEYLYGSSFIYDTTTNEFTLVDTETATWSGSTYEDLVGKYTCKNLEDTCAVLYEVNSYNSNTSAWVSKFEIINTNYAQIGKSPFNAAQNSPAMVGYMFNKTYKLQYKDVRNSEYKYGNSFVYDEQTNMYALSGDTLVLGDWVGGYNDLNNKRYTCWNTSGTCREISYINNESVSSAYYYILNDGKSISDLLDEMISNEKVNKIDSSIKGIIDAWYKKYLNSYSSKLENTVFCNSRNIIDLGTWNPDGGTNSYKHLEFKNRVLNTDLSCLNITDQFSLDNNKAKLKYPIALINHEEWNNIGTNTDADNLRITGVDYWSLSPDMFGNGESDVNKISDRGYASRVSNNYSGRSRGIRPAVSLDKDVLISSGSGSETDPWIIK